MIITAVPREDEQHTDSREKANCVGCRERENGVSVTPAKWEDILPVPGVSVPAQTDPTIPLAKESGQVGAHRRQSKKPKGQMRLW
jgi:hypothetical protein